MLGKVAIDLAYGALRPNAGGDWAQQEEFPMDRTTVPAVLPALILGTSQVAHAFQFRTNPILNPNAEADFGANDVSLR